MGQIHGILKPHRRLLAGLALLAIFACAGPVHEPPPALPTGISPIMQSLHRLSRVFNQNLLLEQQDRYPHDAGVLALEAGKLVDLGGPDAFRDLARKLLEQAEKASAEAGEAPQKRLQTLFGEVMDRCLACHHQFRQAEIH